MDWPSVRDPEEPGCPFCECRDGEVHQVECPLVGPEELGMMTFIKAGTDYAGHICRLCDSPVEPHHDIVHDTDERGDLVWHAWCRAALLIARDQGRHDAYMEAYRTVRAHPTKAAAMDVLLLKAQSAFRMVGTAA